MAVVPGLPPMEEDYTRTAGMEAGCYVSFAIAMLFVAARLYTRIFVVKTFGLDDFFLVVAVLWSVAIIVCVPIIFRFGIGKHMVNIDTDEFLIARKWAWLSQIFYYGALGCVKCAIIALYHRLASQPKHKTTLKWIGGAVLAHTLAAVATTAHMCDPVAIIWQPSFPVGCIDILSFNYFNAAFHIFTDLLLALLPVPILRGLQISQKKRLALVVVFAVGALTIFCTIARQITNAIALNNVDFSWYWASVGLCTCVEVNMGLICASLPALRPLLKSVVTSLGSSGDDYEMKKSTGRSPFPSKPGASKLDGDSGYTTRIFAGKKKGAGQLESGNDSEEHIVAPSGPNHVVKDVEYTVEYTSRGDNAAAV